MQINPHLDTIKPRKITIKHLKERATPFLIYGNQQILSQQIHLNKLLVSTQNQTTNLCKTIHFYL